ncbi:MAG TPA: adenine deaminase [Bacteroidales bacterium]|jgi:adenine deaminase|nr:adenine deaminase [Bacteroidales bacterium]HNX84134.1 adenine deaminase [Bacteroidales bacterium]HPS97008.1 adenine deaminase [Bacteroidales bacterium]
MNIAGKIIDVHKKRIYPGIVTIKAGKIESVTETERSPDHFIMPGLADAHVHIESSMLVPSHFAVAAVRHGTVAVVTDPHEIANVLGKEGVKFMLDNAENVPVKIVFGAPSCVPATSLESAGAKIGSADIRELIEEGKVKFLAEMMNFPGVIYDDAEVHHKLEAALNAGIPIDGHAPGLTGEELKKYISAGITTDHECSSLEEALEKISGGMKILIREGSAARNLEVLAPLISYYPEKVMLCTDDLHPETLLRGHINKLVARLISMDYNLFDVVRAASVNTYEHYRISAGTLRPGDPADFIIVDDPKTMNVLQTWIDGKCVFDGDKPLFSPGEIVKINKFKCTRLLPDEIRVINEGGKINLIVAVNGELTTDADIVQAGEGEFVAARPEEDILKIVVKERYNDRPPAVAFIRGFGMKHGAMASSVAHDSHNIIAVGTNDRDIVNAINLIVDAGGGMAVTSEDGAEILKLPVAGIMADLPVTAMAARYEKLSETVRSLGCRLDAPFMTLSFMALLVIPKIKMSDRGLFDGLTFKHIPLFVPDPYSKYKTY